jgi:hypothetical protein
LSKKKKKQRTEISHVRNKSSLNLSFFLLKKTQIVKLHAQPDVAPYMSFPLELQTSKHHMLSSLDSQLSFWANGP